MYTVDYFIQKFEAIPEERWCVAMFNDGDRCCAQGHCGMNNFNKYQVWGSPIRSEDAPAEGHALYWMFMNLGMGVASINNGIDSKYWEIPTPKQRVLAALYDIKKMQQPQYADITKELAILPTEETPDSITIKILQP